jgi:hypothetical protein
MKQQAKSEARPNEPSEPRAWFLEREFFVLWFLLMSKETGGVGFSGMRAHPTLYLQA